MSIPTSYPFSTLPDYLQPGLDLVFVGINPSLYAVQQGHYFARRTNRFWPALSRSRLSAPVRATLARDVLEPEDDALLSRFGIGFTDTVKEPSRSIRDLTPADFEAWAPLLLKRLVENQPRVACFLGITAFRNFARYALGKLDPHSRLGAQPEAVGQISLFVVPSPSPANAHFRLEDQIAWFDRLAEFLEQA